MARKIFIAYIIYIAIIFLVNDYILKENYVDAIVKAVLSGVVFAALYAIVLSRAAKRQDEKK